MQNNSFDLDFYNFIDSFDSTVDPKTSHDHAIQTSSMVDEVIVAKELKSDFKVGSNSFSFDSLFDSLTASNNGGVHCRLPRPVKNCSTRSSHSNSRRTRVADSFTAKKRQLAELFRQYRKLVEEGEIPSNTTATSVVIP